jgi:hypothetical protein
MSSYSRGLLRGKLSSRQKLVDTVYVLLRETPGSKPEPRSPPLAVHFSTSIGSRYALRTGHADLKRRCASLNESAVISIYRNGFCYIRATQ